MAEIFSAKKLQATFLSAILESFDDINKIRLANTSPTPVQGLASKDGMTDKIAKTLLDVSSLDESCFDDFTRLVKMQVAKKIPALEVAFDNKTMREYREEFESVMKHVTDSAARYVFMKRTPMVIGNEDNIRKFEPRVF